MSKGRVSRPVSRSGGRSVGAGECCCGYDHGMESPKMDAAEIKRANGIINRLKASKNKLPDDGTVLAREDVEWLIEKAQKAFAFQPMLVELVTPVAVLGDTHGQFYDLLRLMKKAGPPPGRKYLFLGDYVDRGPHGVEVVCLLLTYKALYWDRFYLLRGNHETAAINRVYGFYDECKRKFGDKGDMYRKFNKCFDYMPLAALIDGNMVCMHGGISPDIREWDDIRRMQRPLSTIDDGIACDLLWADPDRGVTGFQKSPRGISYLFGADAVLKFCYNMGVDVVIRAHQVVHEGYEFFANKHLLTMFSAPNYCNQFDNAAGVAFVSRGTKIHVKALRSKLASDRAKEASIRSEASSSWKAL